MKSFIVVAVAALAATANAAATKRQNLPCGATRVEKHTVMEGDTLTSLAKQYNSGICDIAYYNGIENPNFIKRGAVLNIPVDCTTAPDNTSCLQSPDGEATDPCVPGVGSTYIVVGGDSLTKIAKDFDITLESLEAANKQNIPDPDKIDVGEIVHIPICPSSQCDKVGTYIIVSGDIYVDLAKEHKTTVGQIEALNVGVDPTKLEVGQQIILPENCHNVTAPAMTY